MGPGLHHQPGCRHGYTFGGYARLDTVNSNRIREFQIDAPTILWDSSTSQNHCASTHVTRSHSNIVLNFVNLLMMSPCHCHLIFHSPVHHHHHHHYHHIHYASLHLSSTTDSKLTFSTNPSHHSLPHLFGRISRFFMTISGLDSSVFVFVFSFHLFCLTCVVD